MKYWNQLPVWLRKVISEVVETSLLALLTYVIASIKGGEPLSIQMVEIVILKAIAKTVRSHPEIPVKDYVNEHK